MAGTDGGRDGPHEIDGHDEIDPRYDPAFQRGYRFDSRRAGPRRSEPSSRARPSESSSARADSATRSTREPAPRGPVLEPKAPAPGVPAPPPNPPPAVAQPVAVDAIEDDADDGLVSMRPPARVNPYIVALWIIGVTLVVVGVTFLTWAQTIVRSGGYNPSDGVPIDVVLTNLSYTVSGPMVTVGLATIVGLIFLRAMTHRRANSN